MKKQIVNPYLPSYEYVPDGEPHVFGERLYIFGSHDRFNGNGYCLNDYVCWSAPTEDLSDWRFEGVIYRKNQDPDNPEGKKAMYAPDVAQGADGKFYLYYGLADDNKIGVAVCDSPAGKYEFLSCVHDGKGNAWGRRPGDFMPFDPAVMVDEGRVLLYAGQGAKTPETAEADYQRHFRDSAYFVELEPDMVTMKTEPKRFMPSLLDSSGTGFEGHEFFEASSIRKFDGRYYYIYSSVQSHELCWAVSEFPDRGFSYGGVLTSNGDVGEGGIPEPHRYGVELPDQVKNYIGNNHGSIVRINGQYYVFGHRHTNRNLFSRQGYAEKLRFENGRFFYTELTSAGLNDGPLRGRGTYDAGIACHLMSGKGCLLCYRPTAADREHPAITQEGEDRENAPAQYIANMQDGARAVYRYFNFKDYRPDRITVKVRGSGEGKILIGAGADGEVPCGEIPVSLSEENTWSEAGGNFCCTGEAASLTFRYCGSGYIDLKSFTLL